MTYILKVFALVAIIALLPTSLPATTILVPQPVPSAVVLIDTTVQLSWLYPEPVNVYLVQGGNVIQELATGVKATHSNVPGLIQWKVGYGLPVGSYQIKVVSIANPEGDIGLSGVFSVQKTAPTSTQTPRKLSCHPRRSSPRPGTAMQAGSEVFVDLAAAIICFAATCHPALVGPETPRGEFQLTHYTTPKPIYKGDFLSFKETKDALYTIHRVVNVPGQQRFARLKSPDPNRRNAITHGCINVEPAVYDELVKCCSGAKVVIK